MPRRPAPARRPSRPAPKPATRHPRRWAAVLALAASALILALRFWPASPASLRARAEAAEASGDWPRALDAWRALNRTGSARGRTNLAEARAAMALDLAAQAEAAATRASEADPADPDPWRLRLDVLRAEGRTVEALRVGWEAYGSVAPEARRPILRDLTLALLLSDDDLPDDLTLARLDRWAAADPSDVEARIARHRRAQSLPRPGDPDLSAWVEALEAALARDPERVAVREALAIALADSGEFDRGRAVLDAWPDSARDARYDRLKARWDLDLDPTPDPARASLALGRVLESLPHDARSHALLARASRALDRPDLASREATLAAALRERLDPATLVPRLASDLSRPDDPKALADLADLCTRLGLDRLAQAWHQEIK